MSSDKERLIPDGHLFSESSFRTFLPCTGWQPNSWSPSMLPDGSSPNAPCPPQPATAAKQSKIPVSVHPGFIVVCMNTWHDLLCPEYLYCAVSPSPETQQMFLQTEGERNWCSSGTAALSHLIPNIPKTPNLHRDMVKRCLFLMDLNCFKHTYLEVQ